jgi:hypothetical protein
VAEHRQRLLDSKATRLKLEFCLHRLKSSLLYSHSDFSSSIALLILELAEPHHFVQSDAKCTSHYLARECLQGYLTGGVRR